MCLNKEWSLATILKKGRVYYMEIGPHDSRIHASISLTAYRENTDHSLKIGKKAGKKGPQPVGFQGNL
jgi:hypothetical protein